MLHDWPTDASAAIAIQQSLRSHVRLIDDFTTLNLIAGVDVSFDIPRDMTLASIVLMKRGALKPIASIRAELPTRFPYIPGLLSFREIPVLLEALKRLPQHPDLLMVDGQGVAHPRRLGIAAHLGVLTDIPSIGVAKSKLCGHCREPGPTRGDFSPLMDKGERIGTVYRSKTDCLPLFISPGHRVAQDTAVALVAECLTRYRLPEPTRLADKFSKEKGAALTAAPLLA